MKLRRPRPAVLGLVLVVASVIPTSAAHAAQTVVVTNVAAAAGLAQTTSTYGAVIRDITGDGVPDVLLNRHWQRPMQLFAGATGDLYSVTTTFPAADRHGCDAADVNQDGRMDVYCDQGASNVQGSVVKANNLYIQQADGSFLDEATAMGVDDPYGRGRDLTFIDANGDVYPDLFVGNVGGRTDGLPSHNWIFINDAGTGFHPDGSQAIEAHAGAHCAIPRDVTADGWQDLLVCDAGKTGGPLRLFRNDAGAGFSEVTTASGLKGTALDAALVDLNGDTTPDVVAVNTTAVRVQLATGAGTFGAPLTVRTFTAGADLAVGDFNADGHPDVYIVRGCAAGVDQPDLVLLNHGGGRAFDGVRVAAAGAGCGDAAETMTYGGQPAVLVMNGHSQTAGPIQLLAFRRG